MLQAGALERYRALLQRPIGIAIPLQAIRKYPGLSGWLRNSRPVYTEGICQRYLQRVFQVHRYRRAATPILALPLAFLGLFGLDALLFRTPLYPSILEPDSSTGVFELILGGSSRPRR